MSKNSSSRPARNKKPKREINSATLLLAVILIVALVLRMQLALEAKAGFMSDSYQYLYLERNLMEGKGLSIGGYAPQYPAGMPITLLVASSISGLPTEEAGKYVSVIFGTLSVFIAYLLGKELFDERGALFSAALLAIFPMHVFFSSVLLSDAPFTFLFLSAILLSIKVLKGEHGKIGLLSLVAAYAFLIRVSAVAEVFVPSGLVIAFVASKKGALGKMRNDILIALASISILLLIIGAMLPGSLFPMRYVGEQMYIEQGTYPSWLVGEEDIIQSKDLWIFSTQYLVEFPAAVTIPVLLVGLLGVWSARDNRRAWVAIVFVLFHIALYMWWWAYSWRYMLPVIATFFIFAGNGFSKTLNFFKKSAPANSALQSLLAAALVAFLFTMPVAELVENHQARVAYTNRLLPLKQLTLDLNATISPNDMIVIGHPALYEYYMSGKKVTSSYSLPQGYGALVSLIELNVSYITFDNGWGGYAGRFDFLGPLGPARRIQDRRD